MCFKYGKKTKFISGLIRHLNICIKEITQTAYLQIYYKVYINKINILERDLEEESQLLNETNYIIRDEIDVPIKKILWNELLGSKFLSLLRKKWFTRNESSASILVSDIKYNCSQLN